MKKIKTVVFDFDGVIADTVEFSFRKTIEIARLYKITDAGDRTIISEIRNKGYRELMHGGFKISWFKAPLILRSIKKMQETLYDEIASIKVFPGIKTVLEELKKRKIAVSIISSNLDKNVRKFLEINGMDKFFDEIICGTHILGKTAVIDGFIRKNKLDKQETVYIGDEIRDVEACKKSGVKIIAVTWGIGTKEALIRNGADHIADKSAEILAYL